MSEKVFVVLLCALTVEAVWETLKMTWETGRFNVDRAGSLVLGLTLAFTMPLDLFSLLGYPFKVTVVGVLLTGVIISRGANFVHDFLKLMYRYRVRAGG